MWQAMQGWLPALLLILTALIAIVIVRLLVRPELRRRTMAITLTIAIAIGLMWWLWLGPRTVEVWVHKPPEDHEIISFGAPRATGFAQGSDFIFDSSATKDEVFRAFIDVYPQAVRSGNEVILDLEGTRYVLSYDPHREPYPYRLSNGAQ